MNLDAVRGALLADARSDAELITRSAEDAAAAVAHAAGVEAAELLRAARQEGEAEAARVAAIEGARARRRSRERVLAARREAHRRLEEESTRAVAALRAAPRYGDLLEGLARVARRQLGADAAVHIDEEMGGLVAATGSRSVDYRLPAIVDRCIAAIGSEVEALWR